ncbi:MAG: carboxypeptidase regulatory-like domain-containing protein [Bacteroidales bacterium]|nr:carboxypeptidase regulatory-like domain-containing protein [Bacteroidales bacterium]
MKKLIVNLGLAAAAILAPAAQAKTVADLSTKTIDFTAYVGYSATGDWEYVGSGSPTLYSTNSSWNNTNYIYTYSSQTEGSENYLVTGSMNFSGDISFSFQKYDATNGYLKILKASKDDQGNWTIGDLITEVTSADCASTYTYYDFTATIDEETPIAFLVSAGALANFTYTPTEAVESISINSCYHSSYSSNVFLDAEGNGAMSLTIQLMNKGDYNYEANEIGIQVFDNTAGGVQLGETYYIDSEFATGASTYFYNVPFSFNKSVFEESGASIDGGAQHSLTVKETATGSSYTGSVYINLYDYTFCYYLNPTSGSGDYKTSPIDFGMVKAGGSASKTIVLKNGGGRDLVVTGIQGKDGADLPENIAVDCTFPFTVYTQQSSPYSKNITFTLTVPEVGGTVTGDVEFVVEEMGTIPVSYTATVPDPSRLFEDFESYTVGSLPTGSWIFEDNTNWSVQSDTYYFGSQVLKHSSSSASNYFITPKVKVDGDYDEITFKCAAQSTYSKHGIAVYYSTDRLNWEMLTCYSTTYSSYQADFINTAYLDGSLDSSPKTITVEVPGGEYWLKFEGQYVSIDDLFLPPTVEVEDDLLISSYDLPKSATVNNKFNASMTVRNLGAAQEAAGYTASLYVNNEVVATAESIDIDAASSVTFEFAYTPHAAEDIDVYMEWKKGDVVDLTTPVVTYTVQPESALGSIVVGEGSADQAYASYYKTSIPGIDIYHGKAIAQNVYPASYLAKYGVNPGLKIVGLAYMGYNDPSHYAKEEYDGKVTIKAMSLTDQATFSGDDINASQSYTNHPLDFTEGATLADAMTLTEILDEEKAAREILYMPFTEGYVYDGNDLALNLDFESASWTANGTTTSTYGCRSMYLQFDTSMPSYAVVGWDEYYGKYTRVAASLPVTVFYYEIDLNSVYGTVTDKTDAPIAGATVTITSGDVIYTATTDEYGQFSADIYQPTLEYTVTVSAEGYEAYTHATPVKVDEQSQYLDIHLTSIGDSVISISADQLAAEGAVVYDLQGRRVEKPAAGNIYISVDATGQSSKILVK